ncbi:MAG TPA: hypothetical protein VKX40_11615 [Aequorivita sp.]|nr:hypothetical protein [Aequorivita sp.]
MDKTATTIDFKEIFSFEEQQNAVAQQRLLRSLFVTSKELKAINLFWIGFILHAIGYTLTITYIINPIILQLFQLIAIYFFVSSSIKLIQFRFDSKYLQTLFVIYIAWTLTIILRGTQFSYYDFKVMLFLPYEGIFSYLAPLVLLFPRNLLYYKKAFDAAIILAVLYVLHDALVIGEILNRGNENGKGMLEVFTKSLAIPAGLVFLTYYYHPKQRKILAASVLFLAALLATYRARRSLLLMSINPLLFGYLLYLINSKKKFMIIFFSIFMAVFLALFADTFYRSDNDSGLFSSLMERGTADTRTNVELCLYDNMEPLDWIIGKGMNGIYYCPNIEENESDYRTGIESDYLNTILKGGIIHLALALLILIPAVFLGLFRSNNLLSKAAAIWILLYLFYLYPAPVSKFNANYLLVWISVGICYSKMIRRMPEKLIVSYFRAEIQP